MYTTPAGYMLTWTCYGTRLHGDRRGSVHKKSARPTSPLLPHDRSLARRQRETLTSPPLMLEDRMRDVIAQVIRDHCIMRQWALHAANVRTNHVHIVVSASDVSPESAMTQLKAWSTRRLREADLIKPDRRVWTRHGSTRYLWTKEEIGAAIVYVRDMQ